MRSFPLPLTQGKHPASSLGPLHLTSNSPDATHLIAPGHPFYIGMCSLLRPALPACASCPSTGHFLSWTICYHLSGPAASNYCLPFKASFSLTLSHLTFLPFPSSLSAKSLSTGLYSQSCHFLLISPHLDCFHFFSLGLQDAPLPITLALPTPMTPSSSPLCPLSLLAMLFAQHPYADF